MALTDSFYSVLGIPTDASQAAVKAAYHSILLSSHPDKRLFRSENGAKIADAATDFDIARIQLAYRTLSNPDSRAAYDASLASTVLSASASSSAPARPRPAQVVFLEEFACIETPKSENDNQTQTETRSMWTYRCRCGGSYIVNEEDLESNCHIFACECCSEVVYVDYEVIEEDGSEDDDR